jgi:hypothetical protein
LLTLVLFFEVWMTLAVFFYSDIQDGGAYS